MNKLTWFASGKYCGDEAISIIDNLLNSISTDVNSQPLTPQQ